MQKIVFSIIILISYSFISIAIAVEPTSLPPAKVNPHDIKGTTAGSGVDLTKEIKKNSTSKNKCKKTSASKCKNKKTTIKALPKKIDLGKTVKRKAL